MAVNVEHARETGSTPHKNQQSDNAQAGTVAAGEPMERTLRLLDRYHEAENVMSFRFEPEQPIDYVAGQYLHYLLPHATEDDRGATRYFTIASAPSEPFIQLTTRLSSQGSSFKQSLARLEPGSVITAAGPSGRFVYPQGETQAVFIAGGIGITPFRSMLIELAAQPVNADITLLYANQTPDIAFKQLFDTLAQANPRLKVVYVVDHPAADWTGPVGRIDAAFIAKHVPDLTTSLFYASGPQPMVKAMGLALADLGVRRDRIKREGFPGYDE